MYVGLFNVYLGIELFFFFIFVYGIFWVGRGFICIFLIRVIVVVLFGSFGYCGRWGVFFNEWYVFVVWVFIK